MTGPTPFETVRDHQMTEDLRKAEDEVRRESPEYQPTLEDRISTTLGEWRDGYERMAALPKAVRSAMKFGATNVMRGGIEDGGEVLKEGGLALAQMVGSAATATADESAHKLLGVSRWYQENTAPGKVLFGGLPSREEIGNIIPQIPLRDPDSIIQNLGKGIIQFGIQFFPAVSLFRMAGAGAFSASMLGGAWADMMAFENKQGTLADVLLEAGIEAEFLRSLSGIEAENEFEASVRAMVEGAAVGGIAEVLGRSVPFLRFLRAGVRANPEMAQQLAEHIAKRQRMRLGDGTVVGAADDALQPREFTQGAGERIMERLTEPGPLPGSPAAQRGALDTTAKPPPGDEAFGAPARSEGETPLELSERALRQADDAQAAMPGSRDGLSPDEFTAGRQVAIQDTRQGPEIVAERLRYIVPQEDRVVGGRYRPGQPDGRQWSELTPAELSAPGPGLTLQPGALDDLWSQAVARSSAAAQKSVAGTGARFSLSASDMDEAMKLPLEAQLWYELSGESFSRNLPDLSRDEMFMFSDLIGVTSAKSPPDQNLFRSLAVMSQRMRGEPIDVDLVNPAGVRDALAREGTEPASVIGNKTGHFSDTLLLTQGHDVQYPISVNDVWVGRMFGVTDQQLGENQALHEPMAIFFNLLRDAVNESAAGAVPHQSWQVQARAWVQQRGASDSYAEIWPRMVDMLKAAGVDGIDGQVITRDALMDPRFVEALRPNIGRFREAPKMTIEVGSTQTEVGRSLANHMNALKNDGLADDLLSRAVMSAYTSTMRKARSDKLFDKLATAITGRSQKITRIDLPTAESPFDFSGSFEGGLSPNIRVPLAGMTDAEVEAMNAVIGKAWRQDAMAASQVRTLGSEMWDSPPAEGYSRSASFFIESVELDTESVVSSIRRFLPENFDFSVHRSPNGVVIDLGLDFSGDVPAGISRADATMVRDSVSEDIGVRVGLSPIDIHSVYTPASEYDRIFDSLKGAVNEGLRLNPGGPRPSQSQSKRGDLLAEAEEGFRRIFGEAEERLAKALEASRKREPKLRAEAAKRQAAPDGVAP